MGRKAMFREAKDLARSANRIRQILVLCFTCSIDARNMHCRFSSHLAHAGTHTNADVFAVSGEGNSLFSLAVFQDQLRQLPPRIPAATMSGTLSVATMASTVDDLIRGRVKILFVSPERLVSPSFRRLFQMRWNPKTNEWERSFPTVSLLCVDGAH